MVNTIFKVTNRQSGIAEGIKIEGCGQEAAKAMLQHYPLKTNSVVLLYHEVSDPTGFKELHVDLRSRVPNYHLHNSVR